MAGLTFSGFNGYDFGSMVDSIMQSESQPLTALQTQQQSVKDKDASLVQLNGFVSRLQAQSTLLGNVGTFANVSADSSNTGVVTTTVGTGGLAGRYDIHVTALAKGQVNSTTNTYAATDSLVADGGSLSFTMGGTTTDPINITSATTLSSLKDSINDQNSGVVASIVNTGSAYKLVLSSRETGASHAFTINNSLTLGSGTAPTFGANTQTARDSDLTVNGVAVGAASNDITEAVPGITLKLLTTGDSVVTVSSDYSAVKESLKTIVSEYNKLRDFFSRQSTLDSSTGKQGPLGGDSVLRQALNDIRSTLTGSNTNGGRYSYLSQIGLELGSSGELKLDETKFSDAINQHASDVKSLFQGSGSIAGVFDNMKTRLDGLDGTAGLIKSSRTSIETTLKSYRDRIESQQLRLTVRRQELQKQFAAADQAISRLNSMSSQLSSIGRSF